MGNEARLKKEADAAKLKKACEDLNDAQLREAEASLALFEAATRKDAAKADMEEVSGLRARKEAFHMKLQELKRAAESDWERHKAGVEAEWKEMERAMEKFHARVEATVASNRELWSARQDAMDARIDRMAARADQLDAQARIRFQDDLAGLRVKQTEARRKLREFVKADEAAADDIRAGAAAAWDDLRAALESAIKRY